MKLLIIVKETHRCEAIDGGEEIQSTVLLLQPNIIIAHIMKARWVNCEASFVLDTPLNNS